MNEALAQKQWLMGLRFSVADAYLFTVLNWAKAVGLEMQAFDNIADYQARVKARPAVEAALKAEGLSA